ncbi:MAG: hypothetical protein IPH76_02765 [Xanthomonadales bacterium]|nr:hypothetical protein [Xanthomonadales bacterium]
MKINSVWTLVATAAMAALLASCASTPAGKPEAGDAAAVATTEGGVVVSSDPRAPLERRATDRWKLLIAKDAARAYTYLTPGYRAGQTEGEYAKWLDGRRVKWTAAVYVDHACSSSDACKVSLSVSVETVVPGVPGKQSLTSSVTENWLLIEGVWYHLPEGQR